MSNKRFAALSFSVALGLLLVVVVGITQAQGPEPQGGVGAQAAVGTAFTYQGRLTDGGSPASGTYDFRFRLYDAASGGAQVGSTVTKGDVTVSDGLFTVQLDFGSGAFNGDARYLEIRVRPGDSTGAYTTLTPRQALTPAPYALALPGLWTQQNGTSPNIIGGHVGNTVGSGVVGAVIAGGGEDSYSNTVQANHTVIGGGRRNEIRADSYDATIGGGWANEIGPNSRESTIGGGQHNVIGTNSGYSTIAGGAGASVGDNSWNTAIGGGASNEVGGDNESTTIGGGTLNAIGDNSDHATIGGGGYNEIGNDCAYTTIAGGAANEVWDNSLYSTIGGGLYNFITDTAEFATIAGGGPSDPYDASTNNRVYDDYGTIGGGARNRVGSEDGDSTSARYATIAGGIFNVASNEYATVGGGGWNEATGYVATIPGGAGNEATGDYSFAAGRRAKADNVGCFVWADSTDEDFDCNFDNQMRVRANGGATFVVDSTALEWVRFKVQGGHLIDTSTDAHLTTGGTWVNASDRNAKENLAPVDGLEVLARLAKVPITTWNYKAEQPTIRHMGPVAQDFFAAFGLGEDERHISTVDAEGVALAAIQGLYQLSQEQAARIEELEARVAALEQVVSGGPQAGGGER